MIPFDAIDAKLTRVGEKDLNKVENTYFCPFCNDRDGKFGFNTKLKVYHCFKCEVSGSQKKLLKFLGIDIVEGFSCVAYDDLFREFCTPKNITIEQKSLGFFNSEIIDPTIDSMALRYLRNRGVSDFDIENHDMRWGRDKYAGRIIIPTYENGDLVYFVARSYTGKTPKYKNPPMKKNFIFNLDKICNTDKLIITEGVFSAIEVGSQGIAIFGKHLSSDQFDKICSKSFNEVIIALDYGAEYHAFILANMFNFLGKITKIINFTEAEDDPDTAGRTRVNELIKNAYQYHSIDHMNAAVNESVHFYNFYCKNVFN